MSEITEQHILDLISGVFEGKSAAGVEIFETLDFAEPTAAAETIARIIEPLGPVPEAEGLARVLIETTSDAADPDMALANWERFFDASFGRSSTASLILTDPRYPDLLSCLFGHSQFLADILVLNPEQVDWLLSPSIQSDKSLEDYESEMADAMALFHQAPSQRNALCRYHRRELLRIGLRDMMGWASLERVTEEISDLAQATIRTALAVTTESLTARYGQPMCEDGTPCGFAVIAMGKLGGRELNYSSDIDLIFVFSRPGKTEGREDSTGQRIGTIANLEYFSKLGAALIEFLARHDEEGPLYRVDMRLRPEGTSGALAHTLPACEAYYLSRARPWERIALLKARGVAGDPVLIDRFHQLATGFVFAPAETETLLQEVARLKRTIDNEVMGSAEMDKDIKRGRGGIREVEFTVAVLVILYGETRPSLRKQSTLAGLSALRRERLLAEDDAHLLEQAYRFFRRIEHALQCVAWRQTHLLPGSERETAALARRCGVAAENRKKTVALFKRKREQLANAVHTLFEDMFAASQTRPEVDDSGPMQLLDARIDDSNLESLLARWRLRDRTTVDSLRRLARGTKDLFVSSDGQRIFEEILPSLLENVVQVPWPDRAVHLFESFIEALGNASGYYDLFRENRSILELLMRLFGTSNMLSDRLTANPGWFDPLISPETFSESPQWLSADSLDRDSLVAAGDSLRLRKLHHFSLLGALRIGVRHILGISPPAMTTRSLATLADSCLRLATDWAIADVLSPQSLEEALPFSVLGMGKLGRHELTFQSDLDVVFISDPEKAPDSCDQNTFTRIAERLIFYLTDASVGSALYRVDARLRPEGKNSPLVTSLKALRNHFDRTHEVWEIQTWLGARVVAGDKALGDDALQHVWAVAGRLGTTGEIARAIQTMRGRLEDSVKLPRWAGTDFKRGRGGLVDLEFLSQFIQIAHAEECREITAEAPREVFTQCAERGWLDQSSVSQILDDYDFLRRLETDVRLVLETQQTCFPAERLRLEALAHATEKSRASGDRLRRILEQRTTHVRECFDRILSEAAGGKDAPGE